MSVIASLIVRLLGDTSSFDNSMKKSKGLLDGLKGGLGGRSNFKEFSELLKGGGALVGLTMMGRALQGIAKEIRAIDEEFGDVKETTSEWLVRVGKAIPVYGEFVAAGQELREVFTGERKELEKWLTQVKKDDARARDLFERRNKAAQDLKRTLDSVKQSHIAATGTQFESQMAQLDEVRKQITEQWRLLKGLQGGKVTQAQWDAIVEGLRRVQDQQRQAESDLADDRFRLEREILAERLRAQGKLVRAERIEFETQLAERALALEKVDKATAERFRKTLAPMLLEAFDLEEFKRQSQEAAAYLEGRRAGRFTDTRRPVFRTPAEEVQNMTGFGLRQSATGLFSPFERMLQQTKVQTEEAKKNRKAVEDTNRLLKEGAVSLETRNV
jgi:hypothetical protein